MGETESYLTVTLDLSDPIEIADFAAFFAGLGTQFDEFLADRYPDIKGTARLYITEVRQGSISADLVPLIRDIVGLMDDVVIVKSFIDIFKYKLMTWQQGFFVPHATKSNMKAMAQTVKAVARDKDGTARITRFHYTEDRWRNELEVEFTADDARQAVKTIEGQKRALEASNKSDVDHERVLMRFRRPDFQDAEVGKRSGELVVIEELSDKPLSLIYGSDMVEQRIKEETRDPDSIFYKGFVVDVNLRSSSGRDVAYAVTDVHQVIDLPKPTDEAP